MELVARTEELRKAAEDARMAREAAKIAEEQRVAAIKNSRGGNKGDKRRHRAEARCRQPQ